MSGPVEDLRDWLRRVEASGDLVRVRGEVDWDEEMGAITYLLGRTDNSPAVLFERVRGYPPECPLLWNSMESKNLTAITFGEPPDIDVMDLIGSVRARMKRRIPPVEVDPAIAPINENVLLGADVDLWRFPVPKHWPLDGGRYIGTGDAVITRDPDAGIVNLGT